MKIFSRYMAGRFFKPFLFGCGLFALLIFLGDLFDKMNILARSNAPLGIILEYLWLEVPYWSVRVIPMATALATLAAITGFIQSGEWIAVQSCGFEARAFWKPVVWCALVVTLASFVAQETVLPTCYRRARTLWQERIQSTWFEENFSNSVIVAGPGLFVQAVMFRLGKGLMERPLLEHVGPAGVDIQLDARTALWDAATGCWVFYDGIERHFSAGGVKETPFARRESDLRIAPRTLAVRDVNPDEMTLAELRSYAARLGPDAQTPREYRVAAQARIAYPFTNLVMCLLCIPISLRLRRSAKAIVFCAALALSFAYLWVIEVGRALGNGGALPPVLAAWAANIVFGSLAIYLIRRYDRAS